MGRGAWHTPGHRVLRAAAALVAALAMLASCSSATEDEARPGTPDASVPASLDGVGEVRVVQITRVPEMATDLALVDGRLSSRVVRVGCSRSGPMTTGVRAAPRSARPSTCATRRRPTASPPLAA